MDGFLHPALLKDDEALRRGRLQIRFGLLGGIMAVVYSALFVLLGHYWGGIIIGLSGLAIMQIPWIVRKSGDLSLTGHLYGGILTLSITSLCAIDGGQESSLFPWMAVVPVCAVLLLNLSHAIWWCAVSAATAGAFVILNLNGVSFLPFTGAVDAVPIASASYLGLFFFLGFLALLFEKGRLEASARFRRAKEKLEVANQELVDLNRQKNEFLNIAAHDLKNPLSIICGYADLLREIESPTLEEIRKQASEILRSGNHMLDIIRNILDVRAIEDGQRKLNREHCDLQRIVSDLALSYQPFAGQKNIDIINEVGPGTSGAWSDPGATRQILDNLISNAVKYTPSGGVIRLTSAHSEDEVFINIVDTGPGLGEDDQRRLWNKFTRLTPKPTGQENSTGLGLWIARRLATEMDGNTYCISSPGKGSTFGIQLPLWTEERKTVRREDNPDFANPGKAAFDRLLADIDAKSAREADAKVDKASSNDIALPG